MQRCDQIMKEKFQDAKGVIKRRESKSCICTVPLLNVVCLGERQQISVLLLLV